MSRLSLTSMKQYLAKSISSINQNKLNGILAEIDLRAALIRLGFEGRISQGGWIARNDGAQHARVLCHLAEATPWPPSDQRPLTSG